MIRSFLTQRLFKNEIKKEVRAALAVSENDNSFFLGKSASELYRDRLDYSRLEIVQEALRAWRVNPIARRYVEMGSQFVIGSGLKWYTKNVRARTFITKVWNHRLNDLDAQLWEWCDELTRSGDLFLLINVDNAGFPFIRSIPPEQIKEIQTEDNDVRQERYYIPQDPNEAPYIAYDETNTEQKTFVLHYAINRPSGGTFGESDLAPLLKWIGRYTAWLEDRARLNRFRTSFNYIVQGQFKSDAEKRKRSLELNANPPKPGEILVTDPSEQWGVMSAQLDSFDASMDGLAMKKMLALGMGIPTHYLAEPESSTSTTAEAAGTPTFKNFEQRQKHFTRIVKDLLEVCLVVRARADRNLNSAAEIKIETDDITERDNGALALAVDRTVTSAGELFDRDLIDETEYLRLVYRSAGESLPTDFKAPKGRKRPLTKDPGKSSTTPPATQATKDDNLNGEQNA